jgi:hypothetical protein
MMLANLGGVLELGVLSVEGISLEARALAFLVEGVGVVLDNLSILYDGDPDRTSNSDPEKITRAARVCECRRKAAEKNGTMHLHGKEAKITASTEVRKDRKARRVERSLRLGDQQYRDRRTYAATLALIEALNSVDFSDFSFSDDDPSTGFADCNDFNVNNTQQPPTLGDIFIDTDPRFEFFLQTQEDDVPVEQIADMTIITQRRAPAGFQLASVGD